MKPEDLNELDLLTACIMGEAEGESLLGKLGVACVIRNRTQDNRWPDDYRRVILQPYQFSCMLEEYLRPEILVHHWPSVAWRECRLAAVSVLPEEGYNVGDVTESSNHYYATALIEKPSWAKGHQMQIGIGGHAFFKL